MKPIGQAVLILGLPRTGTTMTAAILDQLGYYLTGDSEPEMPNTGNRHPGGHSFVSFPLHHAFLGMRQSDAGAAAKARALIDIRRGTAWALKDAAVLPIIDRVLPMIYDSVRVIECVRDLQQVVRSTSAIRGSTTLDWLREEFGCHIDQIRHMFPWLQMNFEDRLDPDKLVRKIAGFLECPATPAAIAAIHPEFSQFSDSPSHTFGRAAGLRTTSRCCGQTQADVDSSEGIA